MSNSPNVKNTCCICEEIETGIFPSNYYDKFPSLTRIMYKTQDFIVIPSVSPITSKHLLFFPISHINNLKALDDFKKDNLIKLIDFSFKNLTNKDLLPFCFEHGVTSNSEFACGINHAHLHLIFLNSTIINLIEQQIINDFQTYQINRFEIILKSEYKIQPYLIFGSYLNDMKISYSDHIPSQYIRKIISKILKKDQWNWKELYGFEDFLYTFLLKDKLSKTLTEKNICTI